MTGQHRDGASGVGIYLGGRRLSRRAAITLDDRGNTAPADGRLGDEGNATLSTRPLTDGLFTDTGPRPRGVAK